MGIPDLRTFDRIVVLNNKKDSKTNNGYYQLNNIQTTRYTLLTFLPRNLYDQFNNVANIYFLFIAILQMIPSISTSGGIPTIALPLICMLGFTAIQAAYEDWKRYKCDLEINNIPTYIFNTTSNKFVMSKWGNIATGDLVVVRNREVFPADMILLASSQYDNRVFVETTSMDGETNLKLHESPRTLYKNNICNINDILNLNGLFYCKKPNDHPNEVDITAKVNIKNESKSTRELYFSCNPANMLLRGCRLRNTAWALGIVIYTGHETKIYMNSIRSAPHKMSFVKQVYNNVTILSFVFLIFVCLFFGLVATYIDFFGDIKWKSRYIPIGKYTDERNVVKVIFLTFFTWVIILANLIPIGMFFYLVVVKVTQSWVITSDPRLSQQEHPTVVRNSDLNDELGQISYICTDKTGTLTRNYMELKVICINGIIYGGNNDNEKLDLIEVSEYNNFTNIKYTPHVDMKDEYLRNKLKDGSIEEIEFLLNLALNNTVLIQDFVEDSDKTPLYSASSTDEEALVLTAHHFGISLYKQKGSSNFIKFANVMSNSKIVEFETILRLDFDHYRNRSSVLVKFLSKSLCDYKNETEYRYILFCKGSDSAIKECCSSTNKKSKSYITSLDNSLEFATKGYRTLCFAKREFKYEEIANIIENFRDNKSLYLQETIKLLESDLTLQGCSGIEDLLQYDVKNTIESFINSGIKLWMLTGDRLETAINIAARVGLIKSDMEVIVFDESTLNFIIDHYKDINLEFNNEDNTWSNTVLVVDSPMLERALDMDREKFANIATRCISVVCARVTPQQKANIVKLIQEYTKLRVLAIGDGGNDCTMIQTANVGVGIHGSEGMQAFNVSDYGISQFSCLRPLVLIHGRLCNRRISILILYNMYKCFTLNMVSVYFGFASLFTGSKIFFELLFQLYNFIYTSIPPLLFSTFDSDVPITLPYNYHEPLYLLGIKNPYISFRKFFEWIAIAIYHAAIAFYTPFTLLGGNNPVSKDGFVPELWFTGLAIYTNIIIIVNVKIFLETYTAWRFLFASILLCISFYIISLFIFPIIFPLPELSAAAERALFTPMFTITIIISVTLSLSMDWIFKIYKRSLYPEYFHLIQNKWYQFFSKKYDQHRKLLLAQVSSYWLQSMRHIIKRKSSSLISLNIHRRSSEIIGYAFNSPDNNVGQLLLSNRRNDSDKYIDHDLLHF
ncbi:phospholipid-translocating P-type flippase family protein [Cryptosporidium andersoni]|uniref:Phospholipid-transporting ATPase n=1 Tax=Cryptosporidium andersoni TaxID=117008 RepID=A0A1J4MQK7_9CRYT|nr:phospholipid-translocating P-type flippase family protein [Cryptosporidium andersoni]